MTDTSPFTPRSTPRPSSTAEEAKPTQNPSMHTSLWQVWKPRLILAAQWTLKHLKRLLVLRARYVNRLSRTQRIQYVVVLFGLIVCLLVFNQSFSRPHQAAQTAQPTDSGAALPKEAPTFSTILPAGKSAEDLGGWRRVSPSDRNAVYAYPDMLAGNSIIVSEQPLPDTFKSDTDTQVRQLATGYSAERSFNIGNVTVYIGKSSKGPQSLIFTTHDLLVLIKSSATIADDQWATYITSLR